MYNQRDMEKIKEYIKQNKLIKEGEVIGVGVSGGSDSMVLLHYLSSIQQELDFEVVAIHINHGIRAESRDEEEFVAEKCRELGVRCYKFKIDSPKLAKERNESLETAARNGRYDVFRSLISRGVVDKIALAHHESDQAETILMHIFRGSGIAGARGMEPVRDGIFIRPMLEVSKKEILNFASDNNIDYVQDNSNMDNSYNRNFIRNVVLPEVEKRWPGVYASIVSFGKTVVEDDDFINKSVDDGAVIYDEETARIPVSYFLYPSPIVNRLVIKVLKNIGIVKDFEKKHVLMIKDLALNGENGTSLKLPFETTVIREYDYVTLVNTHIEKIQFSEKFKTNQEVEIPKFGTLTVKRVRSIKSKEGVLFADSKKIPADAVWRFREDGDVFTKFGGGTKKLKSYLIDKKVPKRLRDFIPVLASGSDVLVIAGIEISEKVKVEENSSIVKIEKK